MNLDPKQVEQWKADHGPDRIRLLSAAGEEIAVKVPGPPEWKRFQAWAGDDAKRGSAAEQLVRDCCLYPDADGLTALLTRKPALAATFANKLSRLAGAAEEVEVKNL